MSRTPNASASAAATSPAQPKRKEASESTEERSAKKVKQAVEQARSEFDATPCIIIGDVEGKCKPVIRYFPMVPAAAAGSQEGGAKEAPALVPTFPRIDWDAPPGCSPFVYGPLGGGASGEEALRQLQRQHMAKAVAAGVVPQAALDELIAAHRQEIAQKEAMKEWSTYGTIGGKIPKARQERMRKEEEERGVASAAAASSATAAAAIAAKEQ